MNVPDAAGFRDAQERLVAGLGRDVTFNFAVSSSYASGVYVDPQTNLSLDPLATPSASAAASASVSVRATVVRRVPTAAGNDGVSTPGGVIPQGKCWLRIPEGTYPASLTDAVTFDVGDERFSIQRFVRDGIAGALDRLYVEGELLSDDLTPAP